MVVLPPLYTANHVKLVVETVLGWYIDPTSSTVQMLCQLLEWGKVESYSIHIYHSLKLEPWNLVFKMLYRQK